MKKSVLFALAMISLLALGSCKHYETVAGDPLETKIYTLDNGLKVFMSVNKEQPRIQTYIAVKVGSKNDPSETTGLAHYFEHLMFKGTESFGTSDYEAEKPMLDEIEQLFETYRQTTDEAKRAAIYHRIDSISYEASKIAIPNEYDKLMAMIGANGTNAWTSADETVYTEDIPSNQIDNWARIQADRFRNGVIRGFHTELETIYEEKNMSLTRDSRKVYEAIDQALFPHHPYGKQTTLGSQEHLKNPSITNVKKYHDEFYVPNNIAICVSGDFNPDEMVAAIEKYFGDWEPNPQIPVLQYEKEEVVTEPIVKEVYGLEAENLAIAWRLPGVPDIKNACIAQVAASLFFNGQAGILDLDVNQKQKALFLYGGCSMQPDYSTFLTMGQPKEGQTLEELKDLALEEVAKLRKGEFDESLLQASKNNLKLSEMRGLESNSDRAQEYVNAFIFGVDWKDWAHKMEYFEEVTKEDVVAWANEFLGENAYAVVYKRQGVDNTVQKISAPKITPIESNRDRKSAFLEEIQNTTVKPIEPVFVDFSKDMSRFDFAQGVNVLYKQNTMNDIFELDFVFNIGNESYPVLPVATDYLSYLGTADKSAEQLASELYALACDYRISGGTTRTTLSISGLSENMKAAVDIVEDFIANAVADDDILANVKSDWFKSRINAKTNQSRCFSALNTYLYYGPEYIKNTTVSNSRISEMTSDELLAAVREVLSKGHEILYYGPMKESELKSVLGESHKVAEGLEALPEKNVTRLQTPNPSVVLAQYDAKQLYYTQYSNNGETFDPEQEAAIDLYNEYFGGGMNGIVFQEMREARGLAYSAGAYLEKPSFADGTYCYTAFIATQNDKMRTAIEAFDDIINNMPESEAAFKVAKEGLVSRLRTERTVGSAVLWAYRNCRRLGLEESLDKEVFGKVLDMTLQDVKNTQEKWVKGRKYTYGILGDIKDLDTEYLKGLGEVKVVSQEEIFGY